MPRETAISGATGPPPYRTIACAFCLAFPRSVSADPEFFRPLASASRLAWETRRLRAWALRTPSFLSGILHDHPPWWSRSTGYPKRSTLRAHLSELVQKSQVSEASFVRNWVSRSSRLSLYPATFPPPKPAQNRPGRAISCASDIQVGYGSDRAPAAILGENSAICATQRGHELLPREKPPGTALVGRPVRVAVDPPGRYRKQPHDRPGEPNQ